MEQPKTPKAHAQDFVKSWRKLHRASPTGASLFAAGYILVYVSLGSIAWAFATGQGPPQSLTAPPLVGVAAGGILGGIGQGALAWAAIHKLRNRLDALEADAK